ncbi:MAG: LacI family DNA-binding transcriptional regulator [Caldilineaceae bacterium]|nr:LacI family DNA-binding transcriptional regulator [Caldilineaceae bacterium]
MERRTSSITIRDVAKRAGVSPATVSRYINKDVPVSGQTAQRIQAVMDELRYVPHMAARHLATQRSHAVGLLLTDMNHAFFMPLIGGIEAMVRNEEYNLLVATYSSVNQTNKPIPIGQHNADGMIVFVETLSDCEILELHGAGFPLVLIYRSSPSGSAIPSIRVDNKTATTKLIDHLIEAHCRRRIVFVQGPATQEDSHQRQEGYRASLEAHGIEYDPRLIISGRFDRGHAYRTMTDFLNNNPPEFDAIFAGNDDSAIGIMNALYEAGLHVPEDVSVVGFDDLELSLFLNPPLTTVRAPTEEVGRAAAKSLFDLLAGRDVDPLILLSTETVIRGSCGCPHEHAYPVYKKERR